MRNHQKRFYRHAVHGLFILRLRGGAVLRRIFEAVTDEFVRLLGDVCKIIYIEAVESTLEYPELNGNTRRAQRLDIALCLRKKRVYAPNERERRPEKSVSRAGAAYFETLSVP